MDEHLSLPHFRNSLSLILTICYAEGRAVPGPSSQIMNPSFERAVPSCQFQVASPRIKNRQSTVLRSDATRPGSWFFVRDPVILNLIQNLAPSFLVSYSFSESDQELRTDLRSGTNNSSPRPTANRSTMDQFLCYFQRPTRNPRPPTPNPGLTIHFYEPCDRQPCGHRRHLSTQAFPSDRFPSRIYTLRRNGNPVRD